MTADNDFGGGLPAASGTEVVTDEDGCTTPREIARIAAPIFALHGWKWGTVPDAERIEERIADLYERVSLDTGTYGSGRFVLYPDHGAMYRGNVRVFLDLGELPCRFSPEEYEAAWEESDGTTGADAPSEKAVAPASFPVTERDAATVRGGLDYTSGQEAKLDAKAALARIVADNERLRAQVAPWRAAEWERREAAEAEIARLTDALREAEWRGAFWRGGIRCPVCGGEYPNHESDSEGDCSVRAALGDTREQEQESFGAADAAESTSEAGPA